MAEQFSNEILSDGGNSPVNWNSDKLPHWEFLNYSSHYSHNLLLSTAGKIQTRYNYCKNPHLSKKYLRLSLPCVCK